MHILLNASPHVSYGTSWVNLFEYHGIFIFGDHFLYSHDLFVLSSTTVVRRNQMRITNDAARSNNTNAATSRHQKQIIIALGWFTINVLNHQFRELCSWDNLHISALNCLTLCLSPKVCCENMGHAVNLRTPQ